MFFSSKQFARELKKDLKVTVQNLVDAAVDSKVGGFLDLFGEIRRLKAENKGLKNQLRSFTIKEDIQRNIENNAETVEQKRTLVGGK